MFIIASYLARNIYRSCFVVLLSLLSLFTIFSSVETIENVDSSIISIFYFQILSAPGRLYDLIPISILMGAALSIRLLSKNNELLILNVSGISNTKLTFTLWIINIPIAIFSLFLSEYVVPAAEIKNLNNPMANKEKQYNNQFDSGYWFNDHINNRNIIINIANMKKNGELEKIILYEFNQNKKLAKIYFADHGRFIKKSMLLHNVTIKTINDSFTDDLTNNIRKEYINTRFFENLNYETNINEKFLVISKLAIDKIPLFTLYRYKKDNMISDLQEVELCNKLSYLLLLFLMISVASNSIQTHKSESETKVFSTLINGVIIFVTIKLLPIIFSSHNFPKLTITLTTIISIIVLCICNVVRKENLQCWSKLH